MGHRSPVTDQMWACRSRKTCRPRRTRSTCGSCRNCRLYCTHRDNSFNESRSGKAWCDSTAAEQVGLLVDPEVNRGHHRYSISARPRLLVPKTSACKTCRVMLPKQRFEHSCKSFCCYAERQTEQRDNKQQKQRKWKCSQCSGKTTSLIFHVVNQPHSLHVRLHAAGRRCVRPAGEGDDSDIITWRAQPPSCSTQSAPHTPVLTSDWTVRVRRNLSAGRWSLLFGFIFTSSVVDKEFWKVLEIKQILFQEFQKCFKSECCESLSQLIFHFRGCGWC